MKSSTVDTPFKGSWADQQANATGKDRMRELAIESAKRAPAIFRNSNIRWYMKLYHVTAEEAREALGYPKPLATISAKEYQSMAWRPNHAPTDIGMSRALAFSQAGLAYDGRKIK